MTEAAFGLIGVIIGGLLTGGVEYVMEKRREQRELRAVARLLAEQLRGAIAFIHAELMPVENDPSIAFATLETDAWREKRGVLASALPNDEWQGVAEAFEILEALKENRWPPGAQAQAIESIDVGLRTLGRITGSDQGWWAARYTADESWSRA